MQAFTAEKTELLATYGADANRGLTEAQAQKNKEQYGENALTRRKPDSLLKRLWDAATEPMLLMLIAAGLIALAVNIVRQVTGGLFGVRGRVRGHCFVRGDQRSDGGAQRQGV